MHGTLVTTPNEMMSKGRDVRPLPLAHSSHTKLSSRYGSNKKGNWLQRAARQRSDDQIPLLKGAQMQFQRAARQRLDN